MSGGREAARWRRGSCSPDGVTAGRLGRGGRAGSRQTPIPQRLAAGGMQGHRMSRWGGCAASGEGRRPYNSEDNKAGGAAGPAQRTETAEAAVPRAGAALGEPRRAGMEHKPQGGERPPVTSKKSQKRGGDTGEPSCGAGESC